MVKSLCTPGVSSQNYHKNQTHSAEVIDILDDNMWCDPLDNGHIAITDGASGGKINDKFVYCGGSSKNFAITDKCFILGEYTVMDKRCFTSLLLKLLTNL